MLAYHCTSEPAVEVDFSILRIDGDDLVKVSDGPIEITLLDVGEPTADVGVGILWVEGDGLIVSYDYRAGRKAPLPEAIRSAITRLETAPVEKNG